MLKKFYSKSFADNLAEFLPDELEVLDTAGRWATIWTTTPPRDVVAFIEGFENTVKVMKREWLPAIEEAAEGYKEKHRGQVQIQRGFA